jgi:hypothetical protein
MDFLKCANEAGMTISDCRYVGMGGTQFYDFHLVHRFLGVNSMISLERDGDTFPRSTFNCPFAFISVKNATVSQFFASDKSKKKTIYWLDYDDGIEPEIISDISSIAARITLGGFAFVTVAAVPSGVFSNLKADKRLEYFQNEMPSIAPILTVDDLQNANFAEAVRKILEAAFKSAFAGRTDGTFEPLFQVRYADSTLMITVGGCFCDTNALQALKHRLATDLPFLAATPYNIRRLNLTDRERALFDLAVTRKGLVSQQAKRLQNLGFKDSDFDAYRELIRFLPRYHESII